MDRADDGIHPETAAAVQPKAGKAAAPSGSIALLFRNDIVKLDLFGEQHPSRRGGAPDVRKVLEADTARQPAQVTIVDGGHKPEVADKA